MGLRKQHVLDALGGCLLPVWQHSQYRLPTLRDELLDVFVHQKITRAENVYAFVLLEHEQVFVASDDAIVFAADCSGQDIVVVWITADGILEL